MAKDITQYASMLTRICADSGRYKAYDPKRYNLFGSNSSLLLLLSYQKKHQPASNETAWDELLDGFIASLNDVELADATFGSGISGPAWLIQHLITAGVLDSADFEESLEDFDELIYQSIQYDEKTKNYDLFMGLLGKGIYFLERYSHTKLEKHLTVLQQIVHLLITFSERTASTVTWTGRLQTRDNSDDFDDSLVFGFAHGMPSILVFICKVFTITADASLHQFIVQVHDTLYTYQRGHTGGNRWFPHYITNGIEHPAGYSKRLAWCYGDLGVAYALLFAAHAIKDSGRLDAAQTHFLQLASYRNSKEVQIYDAGFCHGAAGVAHIFYKAHHITGNQQLLDAAEYWYASVLDFSTHTDAVIAGYKTFNFKGEETYYLNDASLIYGTSGLGLCLITYLYKDFDWDKCFLL